MEDDEFFLLLYTTTTHTITTISIMRTLPPTTVPTTVPVLTEPSLPAGVVRVAVVGNVLVI